MSGTRGLAILVGTLAIASAAGCDGKPTRAPVSGRVLIDDQPLTRGYIRFTPAKGRPSGGEIGPDGSFTLACYRPDDPDGCLLGEHFISVCAIEVIDAGTQRWHAPQKYRDPATSGLREVIDGPRDDLVVRLTWDGQKPFVEKFGRGE